jgi:hypothetical protein
MVRYEPNIVNVIKEKQNNAEIKLSKFEISNEMPLRY